MAKKKKVAGTRAGRSRRGKGENMTEAKVNQVEVRSAVNQGDLQLPEPDDAEHHKKSILGALDKKRTADAFYRNVIKKAQAANIDTDMLLEANTIVRKNDPKAVANKLNQLAFFLGLEGFPLQITVHDTLAGDQLETIYRRFYQDGKDGKTLDNRYPEGSDLHAQAARAWRHGMASNLNPPQSPDEVDAALDDEDRPELQHDLPPPPNMSGAQPMTTH